MQTFSQNLRKKVSRDQLSTKFDTSLDPVDVKKFDFLFARLYDKNEYDPQTNMGEKSRRAKYAREMSNRI